MTTPMTTSQPTTMTQRDAEELFRREPQRYLDVDQGQVAYRRVGSGPDVLFVHGWPASSATFRNLLPHLTPHVTCHLVDLLGAGHSRFDRKTRIDVQQHIDSIKLIVDLLALDDLAVVGHDSGGMIARHAMAGDPRLRAMALCNTEQPQGINWRFRQFLLMAKLPGFEHILSWAMSRPMLRRNKFLLGDSFFDRSQLDGSFEEFFLKPLKEDKERRWAAGQFGKRFDERFVDSLAEVHAKLDVPVKLVWGEDDPFFPVKLAQEMLSTFSNASIDVIPNAKLFVHEERPAQVAATILPTISQSV